MAAVDNKERSRNWVFTWNNPPEDTWLGGLSVDSSKYLYWQEERAPTTRTLHLQGFVCFSTLKSHSQVRALLPGGRIEVMRGSVAENIEYCSKAESKVAGPWEKGERPKGTPVAVGGGPSQLTLPAA